jgi:hypothetical protein
MVPLQQLASALSMLDTLVKSDGPRIAWRAQARFTAEAHAVQKNADEVCRKAGLPTGGLAAASDVATP